MSAFKMGMIQIWLDELRLMKDMETDAAFDKERDYILQRIARLEVKIQEGLNELDEEIRK